MASDGGSPRPWAALLKEVSRSFHLTLRVLPRSVRRPIGLAYLLARATDTVADAASLPVDLRRRTLESLRARILDATATPPGLEPFQGEVPEITAGERRLMNRLTEALEALDRTQAFDKACIRSVLETITGGQILDLDRFGETRPGQGVVALPDAAALDDYTYRVAGCVGEFWTRVCRARLFPTARMDEDEWLTDGIRFGKGLQLINILRDLPRDLEAGRCYLPQDELARAGLEPADLRDPSVEPRLRPIHDAWRRRAESHLEAGVADALGQRAGDPDLPRNQHHARVGAPPQDGLVIAEPGEDAVTVGLEQSWYGQVRTRCEQTVRFPQCPFRWREGIAGAQPGDQDVDTVQGATMPREPDRLRMIRDPC